MANPKETTNLRRLRLQKKILNQLQQDILGGLCYHINLQQGGASTKKKLPKT